MTLCTYHYDPLDRLAHTVQALHLQRYFYRAGRRVSEMAADWQRSCVHLDRASLQPHWLGLQERSPAGPRQVLLGTDQQGSILQARLPGVSLDIAHAPYGYRREPQSVRRLPGFNGEFPDPLTGDYLLGNGYRAFNPVVGRFNSPDTLSPFAEGGLNAYAWCRGDPVNRADPDGHADTEQVLSFVWIGLGLLGALWGVKLSSPRITNILKGAAKPGDRLAAAGAVGQVMASSLLITSRVVKAVEPDSDVPKWLLGGAIGLGFPSLGMRVMADPGARGLVARHLMAVRRAGVLRSAPGFRGVPVSAGFIRQA